MDERCKEILERGGLLTRDEYWYLTEHLHRTDGVDDFGCAVRAYTIFYLPEVKGYCTVYYSTDYAPGNEGLIALFEEKDNRKVRELLEARHYFVKFGISNHAYINKYRRILAYPRDLEMVFHDLSYWKTFSTYKELEKDYIENGVPDFLKNPMDDPEFKAIFDRGKPLDIEDYEVLRSHCNYMDYKNTTYSNDRKPPYCDNVIEYGSGRISIKMDWFKFDPFVGETDECLYHGGFKFEQSGEIVKDYDADDSSVSYRKLMDYSSKCKDGYRTEFDIFINGL